MIHYSLTTEARNMSLKKDTNKNSKNYLVYGVMKLSINKLRKKKFNKQKSLISLIALHLEKKPILLSRNRSKRKKCLILTIVLPMAPQQSNKAFMKFSDKNKKPNYDGC